VSERFRAAPRIIALERDVTLEIADPEGALDQALASAGVTPSAVQRMQRQWPASLAALVGLAGLMLFTYTHGVPAAARWLAFHLPADLEQRFGGEVLTQLDATIFKPSTLPAERQEAIRQKFAAAAAGAAPDVAYRLEFRNIGGRYGVNAMALPGGTIVLLDGLVRLSDNDDALVGVAAHELGHIAGKHSSRQLLQTLGVGTLAAVLWGDFSHAIANVPLALGVLRYSRDFEREADDFAIALLRENGISTRPLMEFFATMEATVRDQGRGRADVPAFLSSHPATEERRQRLREAAQ
jgi:predicted Zn-dependent protease